MSQAKAPPQPVAEPRAGALQPGMHRHLPAASAHMPPLGRLSNQAVQRRLLAPAVQRQSLTVTAPDDDLEREADRMAEAITREQAPVREPGAPPAALPRGTEDGASLARAPEEAVQRAVDEERRKKPETAKAPTPPPKPKPPAPKPPPPAPVKPPKPKADAPPPKPEQAPAKRAAEAAVPGTPSPAATSARPDTKKLETPPVKPEEPTPEERKREEDTSAAVIAPKAAPGRTPEVTPAVQATVQGSRGAGRPLGAPERSFFEPRLGHDLSSVRVHDDSAAARAAHELGARAFTYGSDVYFSQGALAPGTASGRRLLAHELTHTIQQRPGAVLGRKAIQRQTGGGTGSAAGAPAPTATATTGPAAAAAQPVATRSGWVLTFDQLEVPTFRLDPPYAAKYKDAKGLVRGKGYSSEVRKAQAKPDQRDIWENAAEQDLTTRVTSVVGQAQQVPASAGGRYVLKAKPKEFGDVFYIGTPKELARTLSRPIWGPDGARRPAGMQVDHMLELQVANFPADKSAHTLENLELLDGQINQASGRAIDEKIQTLAEKYIASLPDSERKDPALKLKSWKELKENYQLVFKQAVPGVNLGYDREKHSWNLADIKAGKHWDPIKPASFTELGGEDKVFIFQSERGGVPRQMVNKPEPVPPPGGDSPSLVAPMRVIKKDFKTGDDWESTPDFGSIVAKVPDDNKTLSKWPQITFRLSRIPGARYAGAFNVGAAREQLESRGLDVPDFSPIVFDEVGFAPEGILVAGRIVSDLPLIKGSEIEFALRGDELSIYKRFGFGDIQAPAPLKITGCSLVVSASTSGNVGVDGRLDMEIERLGKGFLGARAGTVAGFALEGGFDFDTKLFTEAHIGMRYENGELSGDGTLAIGEGKVPGIRSAKVKAAYAHEKITADGTADLAIPGLESGAMTFAYSEAEGLSLGGSFQLSNKIPGIRGGSVQATVAETPDRTGWTVTAHGEAQPAIPGVDSKLTVDYADGAITIAGHAAYSRGLLSGELDLGATNRPVDAAGNPVPGGPPSDKLTAYGGGRVTVKLTPWLQGTVGIRLLPNGEVELVGEIGLPATVDIFAAKNYDRNIFTIGLDIPIVGVAVAGARVGIFATIQGGLDFSAGIGPGQLQQMRLGITYNPDHEDRTHVTGDASLVIPAHAGLRLFVRGGIGAGIPLVSATAGLELGGQLGLEGAAQAGVHVDWTPGTGLVLDAFGEVYVEPKFKFDITGFVLVEAGAFGFTIELYSKKWNLAAVEYGSGLRLGMKFPVHYEEGKPFDLDFNKVEFQIPDVDPKQVLTGLIEQIT